MKRCAVIGDPVEHSLSPAIHRAGYRINGLDWSYEAIRVAPGTLPEFVASLTDPGWVGLSVTAPHKKDLLGLGEPDSISLMVQGGNTILLGEEPRVYNTDVPGFLKAWRSRGLEGISTAVIVGSGATARSLLVALSGLSVREVTVLARVPSRAAALCELGIALGIDITAQPMDASFRDVDLLASTIPTSATEKWAGVWAERAAVMFDAVYDPWPTPLASAADPDQPVITGLELLAGQAVDQFRLLTKCELSFQEALSAATVELEARRCS